MTVKVMAWVLEECDVDDPIARLILIGLANHGHDDGTEARPSAKTLANYARCSKRTVFRKLKDMEALGVIRRGDQDAVAHIPAQWRPVVYDINLDWTSDTVTSVPSDTGDITLVTDSHHPSDTPDIRASDTGDIRGDDTAVTQNPQYEPSRRTLIEPVIDHSANDRERDIDEQWFDGFWKTYPRRIGKGQARKAWRAALKKAAPDLIISAAACYAANCRDVEPQFIAHPATWLNGERWADEPDPEPQMRMPKGFDAIQRARERRSTQPAAPVAELQASTERRQA